MISGNYDLDVDSRIAWDVEAVGFEPVTVRFESQRPEILRLLSDELYDDDPLAFVRELLQNRGITYLSHIPSPGTILGISKPFQIVSLLDMIEANIRELVTLIAGLVSVKKQLEDDAAEQLKVGGEPKEVRVQLAAKHGAGLLAWMSKTERVCSKYGIDITYYTKHVHNSVHEPERYKTTLSECIDRVKHGIYEKLEHRKFMYMPDDEAKYYDQQELFGSEVSQRFASAAKEIGIAANCYATGNYTACVFHLTRALERALFVLAQDPTLGITIKDAREETWETLINKIESWLIALQKAPNKTTPNKKLNLETYSGPALQFRYFKDHWRNPISHGRAYYDGPQALSAIGKVRDLMESLANIQGLEEEPGMIMP